MRMWKTSSILMMLRRMDTYQKTMFDLLDLLDGSTNKKNSRTNATFTASIQLSMRTITTPMLHPHHQSQSLLIFLIHQIQARNKNYPFNSLLRSLHKFAPVDSDSHTCCRIPQVYHLRKLVAQQLLRKHSVFSFSTKQHDEKWKNDRFAAMRDFFEALNKKFGKAWTPEDYISLDERFYPMRAQSAMKQYNPDKPAKYGILFKSLNCAQYPYTYQTIIYAGKPTKQPSEFYVKSTIN